MATFKNPASSGRGGLAPISFPDVCKTPAPPAPFVPVPYPISQFQENLKKANAVDAKAIALNPEAIALQKEAINNLRKSVGDEAGTLKGITSASGAVRMGFVLHKGGVGKPRAGMETAVDMGMSNYRNRHKLK